ncbi:Ammonium transporter 1 member 2 [Porphyridium purpureum]|uniref:Ammonium transporter n=1 Tax=Porphyridium purpureum TaxID=35688 RepID=A0A5J4Z4N8_PORPP|nr:Ammonium transporter 1 member 2 [Porphyridium purpureum]|eukprot:POR9702..scf295_1
MRELVRGVNRMTRLASQMGIDAGNKQILATESLDYSDPSIYTNAAGGLNAPLVAQTLAELVTTVDNVWIGLNVVFVLFSAYLVFCMQNGFAMLTAGSVRTKNTKNVLLKNLLDACVGAIAYYLFGYAFAYGVDDTNGFIGHSGFALSGVDESSYHFWFFQWTFAATAATIVSGSVAERTSFYAYLGYAFFLTGFVYPVVTHWVWSSDGWISSFAADPFRGGMIDFAGSGVVHLVGGVAGLTGAIIVGPRIGRFDDEGNVVPMPGHSATLCTLGTFLLWFGWYGFNPGSALAVVFPLSSDNGGYDPIAHTFSADPAENPFYGSNDPGTINTIQRCCVTTTLAGATAGLTVLVIIKIKDHIFDLLACLNGVLAGLVAVTAGCSVYEPYMAIPVGFIGACVYAFSAWLLLKLKIDDPLEAYPIHGGCGLFGAIYVGFGASPDAVDMAGFGQRGGVFYGESGDLLLANFVGVICIICWTAGLLGPFFFVMKVAGVLRIPPEMELIGNDVSKHGGSAYPEDLDAAEKMGHGQLRELQAEKADNFGMDESPAKPAEDEATMTAHGEEV